METDNQFVISDFGMTMSSCVLVKSEKEYRYEQHRNKNSASHEIPPCDENKIARMRGRVESRYHVDANFEPIRRKRRRAAGEVRVEIPRSTQ
jgi:hypothetical protein